MKIPVLPQYLSLAHFSLLSVFLSSLQSDKVLPSSESRHFIHFHLTSSLSLSRSFPFLLRSLATLLFSHSRLQIGRESGDKCTAAVGVSVPQHHANHGRGKNNGRGRKIWYRPNLTTCCCSLLVSYCAPRADLAPGSFPLLHLHHSSQCMCVVCLCVCLWSYWYQYLCHSRTFHIQYMHVYTNVRLFIVMAVILFSVFGSHNQLLNKIFKINFGYIHCQTEGRSVRAILKKNYLRFCEYGYNITRMKSYLTWKSKYNEKIQYNYIMRITLFP